MPSPNVSLIELGRDFDPVLENLFQFYLHDLSEWIPFDTANDGRFPFDIEEIRAPNSEFYLARADGAIAGFAVTGTATTLPTQVAANSIRDLFVLRRFRRNGVARQLATQLWNARPGEWRVRAPQSNVPSVLFWRVVISRYARGAYKEERRIVDGDPWLHFRFTAARSV